jgi:GAF domain-containing protein
MAGLRVATAVVLYLSGTHTSVTAPPLPWITYVALATCFGITGVALAVVNKHDARASWLGGIFVLAAAPLTSPFFTAHPNASLEMLWFVRLEAFQPAFLWRFASEFPSPLVGRPAVMFRAVGRVALAVGTFIALVNLSFITWPAAEAASWRLLFHPPIAPASSLFYPILYALQAAFLAALIWRASRGRADERRRLLLFAIGIAAGSAPLLVNVLLETIPSYYAFVHSPVREQAVGGILFGALAVVPFVTAYSVLFDHIVDLKVVLRAALQYALARYTIIAVASVPLVAFVLVIYQQRSQPLEAFAAGARPLLLGGTAAIAFLALRSRHRLLAALDRRYFREEYDTRQLLDRLMVDMLRANTAADLEGRLRSAIESTMHAELKLFVPDGAQGFADPDGNHPINSGGVLMKLVSGDVTAMSVDPSDQRTPFRRLSPDEQRWLLSLGVVLVVPLHAPDQRLAGLLSLTAKRSGLKYSVDDGRFLAAVAASAALTLDNLRLRSSTSDASERPARECQVCSRLNRPEATVCSCGGVLIVSAAPHTLRGIYRFDRRLGSGGMGVVYLARDLNLDRPVAIKTLPSVSPEQSARLRVEARAMAAVLHPNLAVIHGVETWQGTPFLIQEFLPGGTLGERLRSGPLAIDVALRLCGTIAEALDHLHRAGIIHRDVKPSNIGFTERDVPKLFDFGLAKLPRFSNDEADTADDTIEDSAARFGDTVVLGGTPAYMSPEALAAAVPARPALDLWALSVVMFESVTGRRPFGGITRDEIRAAAMTGLRESPSAFNSAIPRPLDEFLLRALSVQQAERPSTAREFRDQIGLLQ